CPKGFSGQLSTRQPERVYQVAGSERRGKSHIRSPRVAPASGSFDKTIQDDTDPSEILQFSSTTGAWAFSKCDQAPPVSITGTGTGSTQNGCAHLAGTSGGSRVTAGFTNGCITGSATVTWNFAPGLYQTFRLADSDASNDTPTTAPSVTVTAPSGGELVD